MAEVMTTFGKLTGPPQVLDLPIDEDGLKAWISRQTSGNLVEAARAWAQQYQERRRGRKEMTSLNSITRPNGGVILPAESRHRLL